MNYGELKTEIATILEDDSDGLAAFIPTAISMAEARIADKVRCRAMEERRTDTLTQSTEFVALDTDAIQVTAVELGTNPKVQLEFASSLQATQLLHYQDEATPYYFSVEGETLRIRPIANQDYTLEYTLWFRLPAFSGDTDTNWILTNHPGIYLYASMAECYYFKMDEDTGDRYLSYWEKIVKELNRSEQKLKYPGPMSRRTKASTP